jgi:hypothetical protein
MNIPFYLQKSLVKMATMVQKKQELETSLYHHGPVTASNLGVTRGERVSWPTMKTMILMMMMTNIVTGNNPPSLQMHPSPST